MTTPITKPTAFCEVICVLFMLALQSVPRTSNKHGTKTFSGESPITALLCHVVSSPGNQQELLAALQTAYVQAAAL